MSTSFSACRICSTRNTTWARYRRRSARRDWSTAACGFGSRAADLRRFGRRAINEFLLAFLSSHPRICGVAETKIAAPVEAYEFGPFRIELTRRELLPDD